MKKIKITAFALAAVLSSAPVLATEIPQEAVPVYLTEESVCITENLISPILEEVQNGLGFGEAWGKASREIHSAVLAGSTNGYGYAEPHRNRKKRDPAIPGYVPTAGVLYRTRNGCKGIDFRPDNGCRKRKYGLCGSTERGIYKNIPICKPKLCTEYRYSSRPDLFRYSGGGFRSIYHCPEIIVGGGTMTRADILTEFFKKSIVPVLLAVFLYNIFFSLAVQYGTVNYIYLLILCGIPFGIRFMFLLPMFFGNLGTGIAMACFNIAIGALIGGIILIWKLLVAVWYVPVTVVRLIRA